MNYFFCFPIATLNVGYCINSDFALLKYLKYIIIIIDIKEDDSHCMCFLISIIFKASLSSQHLCCVLERHFSVLGGFLTFSIGGTFIFFWLSSPFWYLFLRVLI